MSVGWHSDFSLLSFDTYPNCVSKDTRLDSWWRYNYYTYNNLVKSLFKNSVSYRSLFSCCLFTYCRLWWLKQFVHCVCVIHVSTLSLCLFWLLCYAMMAVSTTRRASLTLSLLSLMRTQMRKKQVLHIVLYVLFL